jgi:hypothetical protein
MGRLRTTFFGLRGEFLDIECVHLASIGTQSQAAFAVQIKIHGLIKGEIIIVSIDMLPLLVSVWMIRYVC